MRWFTDLNDGSKYLVFEGHYSIKVGNHLNAIYVDPNLATPIFVTKDLWKRIIAKIKGNVEGSSSH